MKKKPVPTPAQAKVLADLFANDRIIGNGGYNTPTQTAILKKGWVTDTGVVERYPSGTEYTICKINEEGLLALETFLFKERTKCRSASK